MSVILELEEELSSPHFATTLWIHDGAYVRLRSPRAREKDLNKRLQTRGEKLADFAGKDTPVPASFDVEKVTPPEEYSS